LINDKLYGQVDINISSGIGKFGFFSDTTYSSAYQVPITTSLAFGYDHQFVLDYTASILSPKFTFYDPFIEEARFYERYQQQTVGLHYRLYPNEAVFRLQLGATYNFRRFISTNLADNTEYSKISSNNSLGLKALMGWRFDGDILRITLDGVFGYQPLKVLDDKKHSYFIGLNIGLSLVFGE
jgi:hypothetical protein